MADKRKYNLRVRSSKKQWNTLKICGGIIFLLYFIFLCIENPPDALSIAFLVAIFGTLITSCVIVLKDNKKIVDEAKAHQDEVYEKAKKIDIELDKALTSFFENEKELPDEERRQKKLILALLYSLTNNNNLLFYAKSHEWTMSEIKDAFSKYPLTKDFKEYLEDVVFQYKESNRIFQFFYEIDCIIKYVLLGVPMDEKLYSDKVYYCENRALRTYYCYNEENKEYVVHTEYFTDYYNKYGCWEELFYYEKSYKKEDKAIKKCIQIANKFHIKKDHFTTPKPIDIKAFKELLAEDMMEQLQLEEPFQTLADYYYHVQKYGHFAFISVNGEKMPNVLRNLKGLIPDDLVDLVAHCYTYKDNSNYFVEANQLFRKYQKDIKSNLDLYAHSLKPQILSDYNS